MNKIESNYTASTNYLYNGCDINTCTHKSTGNQLSVSKVSTTKELQEVFQRFLEAIETDRKSTFIYTLPDCRRAIQIDTAVLTKEGSDKPKLLFLCFKRGTARTEEVVCSETIFNTDIPVSDYDNPSQMSSSTSYSLGQKKEHELTSSWGRREYDISYYKRFVTIAPKDEAGSREAAEFEASANGLINLMAFAAGMPISEKPGLNTAKGVISEKLMNKLDDLLTQRINQLKAESFIRACSRRKKL